MLFQIVSGPLAGYYWYWSEEIIPNVGVGQTVAAAQTVATFARSDRVPGTVMRKLLLIALVALSPIKPEGEDPQ
jgi:hypothetical protein